MKIHRMSEHRKAAWKIWNDVPRYSWQQLLQDFREHIPEIRLMIGEGVLVADSRYVRVSLGNPNWGSRDE